MMGGPVTDGEPCPPQMAICPCPKLGLGAPVSCSTQPSGVSEEGLGSWGHGTTLEGGGAGQERAAITSPGWDYEPDTWAWGGSDRQAGAAEPARGPWVLSGD